MKILQLTNKVPYPPRDGGAIASLTLARELTKAGHQVVVLAMNTSKHFVDEHYVETDHDPSISLPGLTFEIVPVDTRIHWSRALANLLFSRLPYNAVRFISAAYRIKLRSLLSENNFDFIILDNLYTALYINDIRACSYSPVILRSHNIEHEIWARTAKSSVGLKRLYLTILANRIRRFELSLINQYDALVPITSRDAGHFRNFGNKKPCHVLPTGMDVADQTPDNPVDFKASVAHLGALDWLPNQNGIRWFIRQVWPIVRREIPGIEFHLAGRNAPQSFEAQIASPGVVYHGEIENAAVFIREHPIFIVPVFAGSGMRIKLLDYLSAGRATITTTIGAEGIPVVAGRETFISDQPEDFADHIISLARNPDLCREIGENAITFIKNRFDNQMLIGQLIEFLNKIDTRS
ncbi:MAG: glycosyltransferase family 4 protein [Bacteroidia bacterium]|nr:glycosyltransferase family 4 protein [Bacteroidia bacterium]